MRLHEIMSAPVHTIAPAASAEAARAAMEREHVEHLVVAAGKRIVGVICQHDLLGAPGGSTVEEIMSSPAVTLAPDATVQEAARLISRHKVGCVAVVQRGKLAGIVSTSDLLGLIGRGVLRIQPRTEKWTLAKRGPTHRQERRPDRI